MENLLHGDLKLGYLTMFVEMNGFLFGTWVEDFVHGDLNQYKNLYNPFVIIADSNFGTYLNYLLAVPVLALVQFFHTGSILRPSFSWNKMPF